MNPEAMKDKEKPVVPRPPKAQSPGRKAESELRLSPKANVASRKGESELKNTQKYNQSELKSVRRSVIKSVDTSIKIEEMTSFRALEELR